MDSIETACDPIDVQALLGVEVTLLTLECRPPCEMRVPPCTPTVVSLNRVDGIFINGSSACKHDCLDTDDLVSLMVQVADKVEAGYAVSNLGTCVTVGDINVTYVGTQQWSCQECRNQNQEFYAIDDRAWATLYKTYIAKFRVINRAIPPFCSGDTPEPVFVSCDAGSQYVEVKKTTKTFSRITLDVPCCDTPKCCGCGEGGS